MDNGADVITELPAAAPTPCAPTAAIAPGAELENPVLTGTDAINGTGNASANAITGNDGAKTCWTGGDGNDTPGSAVGQRHAGGRRATTSLVDTDAGDVTGRRAGGGTDTVISLRTYYARRDAGEPTLPGTLAINGIGNAGQQRAGGQQRGQSRCPAATATTRSMAAPGLTR